MNVTNMRIDMRTVTDKTSKASPSSNVHTSAHGTSSLDKDDWRARQNLKPVKVTRKKWLNED